MNGLDGAASFVDFGAPIASRLKTNSSFTELQFNKDFFWSTYIQGIKFDTNSEAFSTLNANGYGFYTVFDSGTSQVMLPPSIY
jgi:hypothetical protein